ncbi:AEC family transporter [Ligilactobacillus sp. WILCCON 0076]|uniref:AEC family transporter n=1 Tax=Ligilactobacillus ubinensis TaxID=2876789 RepID=A0A9X2JLU0_9LACO|nr:AEC family transporter [Ligilactobacillus ubinensis]MCP0887323.1 AEC family transporter [Ligilactobacillus ubinensis]
MAIFLQVMLPVLLIFASGFLLQNALKLDIKPISTLAMYLLLPFLVFKIFYQQKIDINFLYIFIIAFLIMTVLLILGIIMGKFLSYDTKKLSAFLLTTIFSNSGNFGVPIALFAFGTQSMKYAMPIMIIHTIFMGIIGIYIAASGSAKSSTISYALSSVLHQPMNYVIIPGILLNQLNIAVPVNLMKWINMISKTAIPIIMLTLGMQLANVAITKIDWKSVGFSSFIKLIIAPIVAYVICLFFPISTMLRNIMIIMTAMPSAANTTIYAIQYDANPGYVSSCTFVSTIISFVSLTILLNLLA